MLVTVLEHGSQMSYVMLHRVFFKFFLMVSYTFTVIYKRVKHYLKCNLNIINLVLNEWKIVFRNYYIIRITCHVQCFWATVDYYTIMLTENYRPFHDGEKLNPYVSYNVINNIVII
jgi:hypothetical protein